MTMSCILFLPPKNLVRTVLMLSLFIVSVRPDDEIQSPLELEPSTSCELGNIIHSLLTATEMRSLQAQALRQELLRILHTADQEAFETLNDIDEDSDIYDEDKRSLASLARTGSLRFAKRNIAALARAGILKVPPQEREFDYKRSIATLAKNGQLPNYSIPEETNESENDSDEDEVKRSIEALARNGYLSQKRQQINELLHALTEDKRNIGSLARSFNLPSGKRNVASLARGYSLPFYGKRFLGSLARSGDLRTKKDYYDDLEYEKRNLASIVRNSGKRFLGALARNGDLRTKKDGFYDEEKRNIGSFMRSSEYPYVGKGASGRYAGKRGTVDLIRNDDVTEEEKRNIASLKAHMKKRSVDSVHNMSRVKRETDYPESSDSAEYSVPVYQNSDGYDYEEMLQALGGELPDKRFLGRIPQMGVVNRPKTTPQTVGGR